MTSQFRRMMNAALLLGVLVLFSGAKALHLLHDAHHHHSEHVCGETDGDIDDGKTHLHDAHFLTDDCQLCDYVLGTFDLPLWQTPVLTSRVPVLSDVAVGYISPIINGYFGPFFLRGPPMYS